MRAFRDGLEYRLEVDDVRVRILRLIDTKWICLEHPDDDELRDDMDKLLALEVRRFDREMAVWFRFYR